jgi:hypothetical protein
LAERRIAEMTQRSEFGFPSNRASRGCFDCYQSDEFLRVGVGEQHELPLTNHSLEEKHETNWATVILGAGQVSNTIQHKY